jgi:hydrogenase expression/formation protein HypC
MCLGVPGKVVRWIDRNPLFARAEIEFGAVRRVCHMACVLEAEIDEFVIIHAGIAIARIRAEEAQRLLTELAAIAQDESDGPAGGDTHEIR